MKWKTFKRIIKKWKMKNSTKQINYALLVIKLIKEGIGFFL